MNIFHKKAWEEKENEILKNILSNIPINGLNRDILKYFPDRTLASVRSHAQSLGYKGHSPRIYTFDRNFWESRNELNSYYAGYILADGCISKLKKRKNYSFIWRTAPKDKHILETFKRDVQYTGVINENKTKCPMGKIFDTCSLTIACGDYWVKDMKKNFGIIPNKTKRFVVPKMPKKYQWNLLVGYIDGDGCIGYSDDTPYLYFCSCNKEILEWINKLIKSKFYKLTSIENKINKRKNENVYNLKFSGWIVCQLYDFLKNKCPRKLARKWENKGLIECIERYKIKIYSEYFENNKKIQKNKYIQPYLKRMRKEYNNPSIIPQSPIAPPIAPLPAQLSP